VNLTLNCFTFQNFLHSASSITSRRCVVAQLRSLSGGTKPDGPTSDEPKSDEPKSGGFKLPFGLERIMGEPDNLIATDRERRVNKGHIPDYIPEDVRKDLDELGLDGVEGLDEMEEKNMDGYNELGLVPPEGAGSFASPILIPSRMDARAVGYEDPTTHAMFWFNIQNDNNTYYIKDLGLFFKMLHIPDEEGHAAH